MWACSLSQHMQTCLQLSEFKTLYAFYRAFCLHTCSFLSPKHFTHLICSACPSIGLAPFTFVNMSSFVAPSRLLAACTIAAPFHMKAFTQTLIDRLMTILMRCTLRMVRRSIAHRTFLAVVTMTSPMTSALRRRSCLTIAFQRSRTRSSTRTGASMT